MRKMEYPSCQMSYAQFASHADWTDTGDARILALDCQSTFASVYEPDEEYGPFRGFLDDDDAGLHHMVQSDTVNGVLVQLYTALGKAGRLSPCRLCLAPDCPHDDCSAAITWHDETIDTPEAYEPGGEWICSACWQELDEDWLEGANAPSICPNCGRKLRGNPFASPAAGI